MLDQLERVVGCWCVYLEPSPPFSAPSSIDIMMRALPVPVPSLAHSCTQRWHRPGPGRLRPGHNLKFKHRASDSVACTPRIQTQETEFLVQIVLRLRFLVFDFEVPVYQRRPGWTTASEFKFTGHPPPPLPLPPSSPSPHPPGPPTLRPPNPPNPCGRCERACQPRRQSRLRTGGT